MLPVSRTYPYAALLNAVRARVSKYSRHTFSAAQIRQAVSLATQRIYPDFYRLCSVESSGESLVEIPDDAVDVVTAVTTLDGHVHASGRVALVPKNDRLFLLVDEPGEWTIFYQAYFARRGDVVLCASLEPWILGACVILTEMKAYDRLHHDLGPAATGEQSTSEQESLMAMDAASRAYQTYALTSAMPQPHTLLGIPPEACISRPPTRKADDQTLQYLGVAKVPR